MYIYINIFKTTRSFSYQWFRVVLKSFYLLNALSTLVGEYICMDNILVLYRYTEIHWWSHFLVPFTSRRVLAANRFSTNFYSSIHILFVKESRNRIFRLGKKYQVQTHQSYFTHTNFMYSAWDGYNNSTFDANRSAYITFVTFWQICFWINIQLRATITSSRAIKGY